MRVPLFTAAIVPLLQFISHSPALASQRPIIAVFDAEGKELTADLKSTLSDYLATRLAETGRYEVVPRDDLKRRLVEQKKESYKSCYDESCQIEIGKELAAEQVVSTQIISAGDLCIFTVKMFDLRKATTSNAAAVEGKCGRAALLKLAARAAEKLAPREDEDTLDAGLLGFRAMDLDARARGTYAIPWDVSGVVIVRVAVDTSASDAGLREGDVITTARLYQGQKVEKIPDSELVGIADLDLAAETQLGVTVWRAGSQTRIYVRSPEAREEGTAFGPMGFLAATLNFQLRERFGIPADVDGLLVMSVQGDSAAAGAGLQRGDVIVEAAAPASRGYRSLKKAELLSLVDRETPAGQQLILGVWSKGKRVRRYLGARTGDATPSRSSRERQPASMRRPMVAQ